MTVELCGRSVLEPPPSCVFDGAVCKMANDENSRHDSDKLHGLSAAERTKSKLAQVVLRQEEGSAEKLQAFVFM